MYVHELLQRIKNESQVNKKNKTKIIRQEQDSNLRTTWVFDTFKFSELFESNALTTRPS